MRVLLFSAILYLTGVAALLFFKPAYMFNEDGTWKEFGLAKSEKLTPFPVWLFCIVWALISYSAIRIFSPTAWPESKNSELPSKKMKPGYYALNKASAGEEIPRYVFIGEDAPE